MPVATKKKTTKKTATAKKAGSKYIEAVGRRKTAVARVRLTPDKKGDFVVNGRKVDSYFPTNSLRAVVTSALKEAGVQKDFSVSGKVSGGGISAQAEAVRHGIARALVKDDADRRVALKRAGYLKRDPRSVERKKFGKKKARKAPQWSKR